MKYSDKKVSFVKKSHNYFDVENNSHFYFPINHEISYESTIQDVDDKSWIPLCSNSSKGFDFWGSIFSVKSWNPLRTIVLRDICFLIENSHFYTRNSMVLPRVDRNFTLLIKKISHLFCRCEIWHLFSRFSYGFTYDNQVWMKGFPYRQGYSPFLPKASGYINEYAYIHNIFNLTHTEYSYMKTNWCLFSTGGYGNNDGCRNQDDVYSAEAGNPSGCNHL